MRKSLVSFGLLLVWVCTVSGYGQNAGFGDIRGTVTDALNALVPNVDVKVENLDTGVVLRIKTNKDGIFDTSSIIPGKYQVTFTRQGFQTYTRGPITLEAGFININASLKVGSVDQEIVVNNDVTLLNTESGEQSTTLTFEQMNELPNYGVSWTNNLVLLPGAVGTTSGAGGVQNPGEAISINGVLPYFTNILQDGASVIAPHSFTGQTSVFHSVAEVQISTNAFSAEYGVGGIVMNQITKSGTKNFHGSAYYYVENDAFNAFPYEFTTTKSKPRLRYDHFGGTIGGPILKKHLFVFFNYDRIINNSANLTYENLPTPATLQGGLASSGYNIYDPATYGQAACAVNGKAARCQFPGNVIPSNRIDPVAAAILSYYPTPNQPGTNGQRNYAFTPYLPNTTNNYFGRADYTINNTQRMFVTVTNQDAIGASNSFGICPVGCSTTDNAVYSVIATHIWTISPKWLNEARMGMFKQISVGNSSSKGQGYPQKIGLQYSKYDEWPTVTFTGGGYSELPASATDYLYLGVNYNPSDAMTLIEGKHILRFGGELLALQDNSTPYPDITPGNFTFSGVYTEQVPGCSFVYVNGACPLSGTNAGFGLADLLLGDVNSWTASVRPRHAARQKSPQAFFQDDYKIRPNLTLNLGIRYQIQLPWKEIRGLEGAFDPTVPNPPTNVLGAIWFAQNGTNGRQALEQSTYNIFLPRVGLAFQPRQGMSIRGGFGMYTYGWSLDAYGNGIGYAAGGTGNATDYADVTPITTLSGPGIDNATNTPLPYVTNANGFQPNALNGQSVSYTNYHMPVARVMQYNVSVGQEVSRNIAILLSYVGSHGYNENFYHDVNQVPQADLHFGPTTAPYRPYPLFGTINGYDDNTVSNYNSLQAVITKRYTKGFTFNFNYTWSKLLDEFDQGGQGSTAGTQPYQNSYDVRANYGPSNFDHRNAFKGSGTYELPFGIGKKWANHNRYLDAGIGGWRLSGTIVSQSGNPLTPVYNTANNSYALSGTWYPNVVGNPKVQTSGSTAACCHNINGWFNELAYQQAAPGTFGNATRNGLVYGPGLILINASLRKAYTLPKNLRLEIRCDANNATNHTNFGNPSTSLSGINSTTGFPISPANISSTSTGPRVIQLGAQLTF